MTDDAPRIATELWDRVIALAECIAPDQWSWPTPCTEWDVHDLAAHMNAVQIDLDTNREPEGGRWPLDPWTAAGVAARRDWTPERLLDGLREARASHARRLAGVMDWNAVVRGPGGEMSETRLLHARCFDTWCHLWDLSVALGEPFDLKDRSDAAALAYEWVLGFVPYLFVKRVGAGEGATLRVLDRVLVVRDGRASWGDGESDSAVTGPPAVLTLVVSGRQVDGLEWRGPYGEAFVSRARLFG